MYVPILFYAVLVVYIFITARNNAITYGYLRNWMFKLQRITGVITFLFIVVHVWQTRIQVALGSELSFDLMADLLTQPWIFWFYAVGVISTTFHLANGLWSFCVSWGIAQPPRSHRVVSVASIFVFLGVTYLDIRSIIRFAYGV